MGDGIPTPKSPLTHVSAPVSVLVGALQLILRVPDLPSGNYPVSVTTRRRMSNSALLAVVHP